LGLFDWFTKKQLSKAEINSIDQTEWVKQKYTIDQIIINECNKLQDQNDLVISLETGLHKEFVTKIILNLFIDNFGYELGAIHGMSYNVTEVAKTRNEQIVNSFFEKIDRMSGAYHFRDIRLLKKCYKTIADQVCMIGRNSGREKYHLFKDTIIKGWNH
jgi:hypothetical protein